MRSFGPNHEALKALINQHFGIRVYGFDYEYRDNTMMGRGEGIRINLKVLSPDYLLHNRRHTGSVIVDNVEMGQGYSIGESRLLTYNLRLLCGPLTNQFLKVMNHVNHPERHPRGRRALSRDYRRFKVEAAGAYRGHPAKPPANGRRFNVFGRPV